MVIDLKPEQQRVIDLAIQSGAYHDSDEVIASALSMLAKTLRMWPSRKPGIMSHAPRWPRWKPNDREGFTSLGTLP